jgi:hypothetical protein
MALGGYPKTFLTPKIHTGTQGGSGTANDITVDAVCDLIKVTGSGDSAAGHGTFRVWYDGDNKNDASAGHLVELAIGDVFEGPFIKVFFDATESAGTETEGHIYERSSITS